MYKCQYRATFSPIFSKINVINIKLWMSSKNSARKLQILYFSKTKKNNKKNLKIGEKVARYRHLYILLTTNRLFGSKLWTPTLSCIFQSEMAGKIMKKHWKLSGWSVSHRQNPCWSSSLATVNGPCVVIIANVGYYC